MFDSIEAVVKGLGMSLVELNVSRQRTVRVRAVVYSGGPTGIDDCSRVHRAIMPRLELAFPKKDLSVEVSSPGIERLLKDGSEFANYIGRPVRCCLSGTSEWVGGVLRSVCETHIVIERKDGIMNLSYDAIAKAKLDSFAPETRAPEMREGRA